MKHYYFNIVNRVLFIVLSCSLLFYGCEKRVFTDQQKHIQRFDRLQNDGIITGELRPFDLVADPEYSGLSDMLYLDHHERVLVYKSGSDIYVYPLNAMYVEVVNDFIGGQPVAITYCPLTRSGILWNRILGQDTLLLTASGYLYLDNLMPLDLESGTIFSQMLMEALQGPLTGLKLNTMPLIELSWGHIIEYFPGARIFPVIGNAGRKSSSGYTLLPFTYTGEHDLKNLYFGFSGIKETVLYPFHLFSDTVTLINQSISGLGKICVAGSEYYGFITGFKSNYSFTAVQDLFPVILKDDTGTLWDIFGMAVSGPRKGERLQHLDGYLAFDWAWESIFEDSYVYGTKTDEFSK